MYAEINGKISWLTQCLLLSVMPSGRQKAGKTGYYWSQIVARPGASPILPNLVPYVRCSATNRYIENYFKTKLEHLAHSVRKSRNAGAI